MYLKLIREPADGKSVRGVLYKVHFRPSEHHDGYTGCAFREEYTRICTTMENADYLILPLIYRVDVTMSPKFGRLLPILLNVPASASSCQGQQRFRTGIRIHRGTRPEHSLGCILVPGPEIESYVTDLLHACTRSGEEVRLEIS